jgi:hypothetical protein
MLLQFLTDDYINRIQELTAVSFSQTVDPQNKEFPQVQSVASAYAASCGFWTLYKAAPKTEDFGPQQHTSH